MLFSSVIFVFFCSFLASNVIFTKPNHDKRIIDDDLSSLPHNMDGRHNDGYDHEAFLGKDEAKRFDDMSPEESKKGLEKIFEKMDTNKDGKISKDELSVWILNVSKQMMAGDVDQSWKDFKLNDNESLSWKMHIEETFGLDSEYADEDKETRDKELAKDEMRWKVADENGDGLLSKDEYLLFLHPEVHPRMRDVVIKETLEDIDTNKNGFVDIEEYIHDLWNPSNPNEEEPEWVKNEREQFSTRRDTDGDGKLNHDEIGNWIIPPDYDHVKSEVTHLFSESDTDADGMLTKEEVLLHHDVFVGSQATNYGEILSKHDEL